MLPATHAAREIAGAGDQDEGRCDRSASVRQGVLYLVLGMNMRCDLMRVFGNGGDRGNDTRIRGWSPLRYIVPAGDEGCEQIRAEPGRAGAPVDKGARHTAAIAG